MPENRAYGTPLLVPSLSDAGPATRLDRIRYEGDEDLASHDEFWLQRIIHQHSQILPIEEIEPAYRPVIPVCMELQTGRGYIDNFHITPNGNLIFSECKLWRNPDARRQVVAQVLDYIESLSGWLLPDLEAASRRACENYEQRTWSTLYELVSEHSDLEESKFNDAVSRNLGLGRGLFLIVGDGIREEAETLVEHVNAHANLRFGLALIEIAGYRLPNNDGYLLQPYTAARTINLERALVRIEGGQASVSIPKPPIRARSGNKTSTLSEEEFFEGFAAKHSPKDAERFKALLSRLEDMGIKVEIRRSINFRWKTEDGTLLPLGFVQIDGQFWVEYRKTATEMWSEHGLLGVAHSYQEEMADIIGGQVELPESGSGYPVINYNKKIPRIHQFLDAEEKWLECIGRLRERIETTLTSR